MKINNKLSRPNPIKISPPHKRRIGFFVIFKKNWRHIWVLVYLNLFTKLCILVQYIPTWGWVFFLSQIKSISWSWSVSTQKFDQFPPQKKLFCVLCPYLNRFQNCDCHYIACRAAPCVDLADLVQTKIVEDDLWILFCCLDNSLSPLVYPSWCSGLRVSF